MYGCSSLYIGLTSVRYSFCIPSAFWYGPNAKPFDILNACAYYWEFKLAYAPGSVFLPNPSNPVFLRCYNGLRSNLLGVTEPMKIAKTWDRMKWWPIWRLCVSWWRPCLWPILLVSARIIFDFERNHWLGDFKFPVQVAQSGWYVKKIVF